MIKQFKVNGKPIKWEEEVFSWIDAVDNAEMDTNDESIMVSFKIFDKSKKVVNEAIIVKGQQLELEEWQESEEKYKISFRVRKNGTVS